MTINNHYNSTYFKKFEAKGLRAWLLRWIDKKGAVIKFLKKRFKKNTKLLEYGFGNGLFLRAVENYFNCIGIDLSVESESLAKKNGCVSKLIVGKENDLVKLKEKFKVITCFDVLEHIKDIDRILEIFKEKLSQDGILVVSVPNTGCLTHRLFGKNWWGYSDSSHVRLINREEWLRIFSANGFKPVKFFSAGIINHPQSPYRLPGWMTPIQWITQFLGVIGVPLPSIWSDVDILVMER